MTHLKQYPNSVIEQDGTTYTLARAGRDKKLCVQGDAAGFSGETTNGMLLCPLTAENAAVLRGRLTWLNPVPLGVETSFGFGDRLGAATPGHIRSVQGTGIAPIFAQQSVRENDRIGRTPQEVVDDAMWGVVQMGWRDPWGADADHVKLVSDLPAFVAAGYTFYTIDPSDHVDNEAETDSLPALRAKVEALPWARLNTDLDALRADYLAAPIELTGLTLTFSEESLLRALAKYGRAIVHTLDIAAALDQQMGGTRYDLEMSVDETETPTSIYEHYFMAHELLRRDLPVVSLAPPLCRQVSERRRLYRRHGPVRSGVGQTRGHSEAFRRLQAERPHRLRQVQHLPAGRQVRRGPGACQDRRHQLSGSAARHRRP